VGLCLNAARLLDVLTLGWVALELTGSPFLVGVAAFCRAAPMMALGPLGGALADRVPLGRLLLCSQVASIAAALALAWLFRDGSGPYRGLLLLELVLGSAWAFDFTARRTAIFTLVGRGRLTNAVSLETVGMQVAKVLGPLAGGVLLARIGPVACYSALAILYSTAVLLTCPLARRLTAGSRHAGGAESAPPPSAASAVAEIWRRGTIRGVLIITVCMNVLVFPYQQMLPVFARDVLHVGPALLGLMYAADGLGSVLGALALGSARGFAQHTLVFAAGSLGAATVLLGFSLAPWYGAALALLLLMGVAESGFATMQSAIVLLAAPDRLRGRAMGLLSACIGSGPLGALWLGFAATILGAPAATALGAAAALALMAPVATRLPALETQLPR
jgi:predicted MFS family arabinose efflux permease